MRSLHLAASAFAFVLARIVSSQFVKEPTGLTTLKTPGHPDVVVRYKQPPPGICETRNPKQKQYTGHVYLPPSTLEGVTQDYPINTFFWFVEAEENPETAPLTIWLNGGPGSSSMLGMWTEVGPCEAKPFTEETIGTVAREYSWDAKSNMIFMDQPNQVGYSYDVLANGSLALLDMNGYIAHGEVAPPWDEQVPIDEILSKNDSLPDFLEKTHSTLLMNGTFPSGNMEATANTTQIAAIAAWHFLQAWLLNFPQYNPETRGVNLFAESYGGKYGPSFFKYFERQNERRQEGELSKSGTVELHLNTLGIVNGCIDSMFDYPSYPLYATENPYGVVALNQSAAKNSIDSFYRKGGCKDQIQECRDMQEKLDPNNYGNNKEVNAKCQSANQFCGQNLRDPYRAADRSFYDITQAVKDPFPPKYFEAYLNNATVQDAVGSPVNYTDTDTTVYVIFDQTGDFVRGGQLEDISYLLEKGVHVGLIYGDRDFICNYKAGEQVSLAVNYTQSAEFAKAGYEDIQVTPSFIAGQVRQAGNFSFSRVYQAGHLIPAYQPQAALAIFERMISGKSIAKGDSINPETYSTTGPNNSTKTLKGPPPAEPTCFIWDVRTCTQEDWTRFGSKQGTIDNGVWTLSNETFTIGNYIYPNMKDTDEKKQSDKKQQGGGEFEGDEKAGAGITTPSLSALVLAFLFLVIIA